VNEAEVVSFEATSHDVSPRSSSARAQRALRWTSNSFLSNTRRFPWDSVPENKPEDIPYASLLSGQYILGHSGPDGEGTDPITERWDIENAGSVASRKTGPVGH